MLKRKKKIEHIVRLAKKFKDTKRVDLFYRDYLLKNKFAKLMRLSLLSILKIK